MHARPFFKEERETLLPSKVACLDTRSTSPPVFLFPASCILHPALMILVDTYFVLWHLLHPWGLFGLYFSFSLAKGFTIQFHPTYDPETG